MTLIIGIIRPDRPSAVKAALFRARVTRMTLTPVSGHGGEREVLQSHRAARVLLACHEEVRIEMACSERFAEPTIQAILGTARTGASHATSERCAHPIVPVPRPASAA